MKKLIVLLLLLFVVNTVTVFAAPNKMPTSTWSFTTKPDTAYPYVTDKFPIDNAVNISTVSVVSCHVKDDEAGVNVNTIKMKINGIEVLTEITGDKKDYVVKYTPLTPFSNGTKNIITVDADDLAL